ncbi:uncharacterized protein LOC144820225 [Lissotriton helveticus]
MGALLKGPRAWKTKDCGPSASFYCCVLSFWLVALAQQGVNSNSVGTMDNRKFQMIHIQNTKLPDTKCGIKILRKRSIPYDTWLTGFESPEVNCQIIDLTSPMPTVIVQPTTKAAVRTTTKAATTRRRATDIKVIPTTKKKPQVAVTEEESRLFYMTPFVPFRSYIPTIRYQEVPYYTPQYGSYFPFYHGGYFPSLGPDAYYNLMFMSTQRDGSSEEDGRKKRETSNMLKSNLPHSTSKHNKFVEYLLSRKEVLIQQDKPGTTTPDPHDFRHPFYSHSSSHKVHMAATLLKHVRVKKKAEFPI